MRSLASYTAAPQRALSPAESLILAPRHYDQRTVRQWSLRPPAPPSQPGTQIPAKHASGRSLIQREPHRQTSTLVTPLSHAANQAVADDAFRGGGECPVQLAESAIGVARRMNGPVFLPQHQQVDAGPLELAHQRRPVRFDMQPRANPHPGVDEELGHKALVRDVGRQRPADPRRRSPPQILPHRTRRDAKLLRDGNTSIVRCVARVSTCSRIKACGTE